MKKEIPLAIINEIDPIIKANLVYIKVVRQDDTYYTLLDKDLNSSFFLKIFKEKPSNMAVNVHEPGLNLLLSTNPKILQI